MKTKWKVAIACAVGFVAFVGAATWLLLRPAREGDPQVTLTFQRYSDLDPYVGDVAFFGLTNTSSKTYLLTMTGATNTLVLDTSFGQFKQSLMVNCEFTDQTPTGQTNWSQLPSPVLRNNAYASLAPHSGIVVRVPVPPVGTRRKVAVFLQAPPAKFWSTRFALPTIRILVRILPRSQVSKLFKPVWVKAPCDTELTNHWSGPGWQR
jgi:hypothetical protein